MGVSVKEGETIKWNEKAFEGIQVGDLNKGLTLHYWYNKDKISYFNIIPGNPKNEAQIPLAIIGGIIGYFVGGSIISSIIFSLLSTYLNNLFENAILSISVSVIFKNGNILSTTAFYGDWLIFIKSITIYGYRYGAWALPDIDNWRGHP